MNVSRLFPQLLFVVAMLVASPGWAGDGKPILIRSHAGKPDSASSKHLDAFARALGSRALMGPALSEAIEARLSRSPGTLNGGDSAVIKQVQTGRRAFIDGDFQRAVKLLEPARKALMTAEGRLASNQSLRGSLHTALLMLGHTYLRLKQPEKATEAVSEAIRSFPDRDLSLVNYAPELVKFYKKVRLQVRRQKSATLRIVTEPPQCMVFVNGRFAGMSPARVEDLYPGRYTVYVRHAQAKGRVHQVVMDGGAKQLSINCGLESVLGTGGEVALRFADAAAAKKNEVTYAASVARATGAPRAIVVGVRTEKGSRVLRGTTVSTDTGREVRTASVSLEPAAPSKASLQCLASFLVAPKSPPQCLGTPPPPPPPPKVDRESKGGWMGVVKWVAVGVAVAGLGAGIPLIALDGQGTCDTGGRCPEHYETMAPGIAATAVGGVAAVGAVVLFVLDSRDKKRPKKSTMVTPVLLPGGVGVGATVRF